MSTYWLYRHAARVPGRRWSWGYSTGTYTGGSGYPTKAAAREAALVTLGADAVEGSYR